MLQDIGTEVNSIALKDNDTNNSPPQQYSRATLWWYWMPEGRWVYWRNNQWNDYSTSANCITTGASASAGSNKGQNAGGFILSGFERATEESSHGCLPSAITPSATYGPTQTYQQNASDSAIGPIYGHGVSSVGYPTTLGSTEVGPFYGKADSSVRYPPVSGRVEVGPFYGKADSSAGIEVDRSRLANY
jgi:hypothetical protein